MKFVNREYGFAGRPPYFNGYSQVSDGGATQNGNVLYPKTATVGYGLDVLYPNTLFLQGERGTMWCVSVQIKKGAKWQDAVDLVADYGKTYLAKHAAVCHAEGAAYGATFAAVSQNSAVISFSTRKKCVVRLVAKPVGSSVAALQSEGTVIKGRADARGVIPGEIALTDKGAEIYNRYTVVDDTEEKEYFVLKSYTQPTQSAIDNRSARYEFLLNASETLTAYAAVGDKLSALDVPEPEKAAQQLTEKLNAERQSDGEADAFYAAIQACRRHLAYDPYLMSLVMTETLDNNDGYFGFCLNKQALGAIIAAMAGEVSAAEAMAQTAATDPIFGALCVLMVYRYNKNKLFLQSVLPRMMEVWEPNDKLCVADSATGREVCFGQEGSPLKEDARRGAMYSLDMSCYKLAYFKTVMQLLSELGVDASDYRERAVGLQKNINLLLYSEERGLYLNRYTSGAWAAGVGFTSFLPFFAGAVTDTKRINDLVLSLTDEKKFWGGAMIPTLSKDHPFYAKRRYLSTGVRVDAYECYCGMIAPWANYLVYCGLKTLGAGELCRALASASLDTFEPYFKKFGAYPEYYLPSAKKSGAAVKRSLSALILPLLARDDLLGYDVLAEGALCFGTLSTEPTRVQNVLLNQKVLSLKKEANSLSLYAGGEEILRADPGNFEIRGFLETERQLSFLFRAEQNVRLALKTPWFKVAPQRKITFHIEAGKHLVVIKDDKVQVTKISL